MRLSAILTTLVGLAVAGGSAYVARDYVERSKAVASVAEESEMISVLVARSDISLGQKIEAHLLEAISWPREQKYISMERTRRGYCACKNNS